MPADARLVDGTPLTIDESLLTGESVPVIRDPASGASAHAGTLVTGGHAIAEVVETGGRTELGRIGATLEAIDTTHAPIQRQLARLVPAIAAVAIALSLVLAAIRIISGAGWRCPPWASSSPPPPPRSSRCAPCWPSSTDERRHGQLTPRTSP